MRKKLVTVFTLALFSIAGAGIQSASAAPIFLFPVESKCVVTYTQGHHDYPANDIVLKNRKAKCNFLSPVDGVIDEVSRDDVWKKPPNRGIDRGGLFVSIISADGVRYYGSHLLKGSIPANIQPGVAVTQGTILGLVGATGSARGTAPHLHFGISWPTPTQANVWWVRRGALKPYEYLKAWQAGKDLNPLEKLKKVKYFGTIPAEPKN
jgi:hypothetical protein